MSIAVGGCGLQLLDAKVHRGLPVDVAQHTFNVIFLLHSPPKHGCPTCSSTHAFNLSWSGGSEAACWFLVCSCLVTMAGSGLYPHNLWRCHIAQECPWSCDKGDCWSADTHRKSVCLFLSWMEKCWIFSLQSFLILLGFTLCLSILTVSIFWFRNFSLYLNFHTWVCQGTFETCCEYVNICRICVVCVYVCFVFHPD